MLPAKKHLQNLALSRWGQRATSTTSNIPLKGKTPPSLEEFDPLNPGDWQIGVGGKLLPRLPVGTKVGKLVMGKYGLYDPKLRKKVEEYAKGLEMGRKSQDARPFDRRLTQLAMLATFSCVLLTVWNIAVIILDQPLWPFQNAKKVGMK